MPPHPFCWDGLEAVRALVETAAPTDASVLIRGENGTGKEEIALHLHRMSLRAAKPFVRVNCAAIPKSLIESELFGHVKGSFTGAVADQPGQFELAGDGSLFIDEVGETELHLQVKLLTVLSSREFRRLGAAKTSTLMARLIFATNADLERKIDEGSFREDFYYRINVIPVYVPALRDASSRVRPLVQAIAGGQFSRFDSSALQALKNRSWRGNVRELENVVERLLVLEPATIDAAAVERWVDAPAPEQRAAANSPIARPELLGIATGIGAYRNAAESVRTAALALATALKDGLGVRSRENVTRLVGSGVKLRFTEDWLAFDIVAIALAIVMRWDLIQEGMDATQANLETRYDNSGFSKASGASDVLRSIYEMLRDPAGSPSM